MTAPLSFPAPVPTAPNTATPPRRTWALVTGAVLLVVCVGGAVLLWLAGDRRYDDNVEAFARAPVGCDTTLDFDRDGEFVLYLETTGTVSGIGGDCDLAERYDRPSTGLPRPELTLRGPSGDTLVLGPTGGVDYDTGDFVGTAYRLVEIDAVGDHVLTVGVTEGEPFAIAIGRDPSDGVALLRWGAVAALIVGLIGGGALLWYGSRRPPLAPIDPPPWQPSGPTGPHHAGWPASPPGFPTPPPTTGVSGPAAGSVSPGASPWAPPPPPSSTPGG